jgi:hypothetical protein
MAENSTAEQFAVLEAGVLPPEYACYQGLFEAFARALSVSNSSGTPGRDTLAVDVPEKGDKGDDGRTQVEVQDFGALETTLGVTSYVFPVPAGITPESIELRLNKAGAVVISERLNAPTSITLTFSAGLPAPAQICFFYRYFVYADELTS